MKVSTQLRLRAPQSAVRAIPDLRRGERVLAIMRRHPAVLCIRLTGPLLLFLIWVGSLFLLPSVVAGLRPEPFALPGSGPPDWLAPLIIFCWLSVSLLILTWGAYVVFDWLDHWIALTTRRVIIMDKVLFLRETRREAPILKIQNVSAEYPHPLGTALDFGNVRIDTAGVGVLTFESVPRPKAIREAVFAQQAAWRSAQPPPEDYRRAAIRGILEGRDPSAYLPPGIGARLRRQGVSTAPHEVIEWRKHPFYLARSLVLPLFGYGSLLTLWAIVAFLEGHGLAGPLAGKLGWLAALFSPLCLAWVLWSWEDWRNDVYKLDHERVYHIESLPLGFREQSKETLITRITDVSYVVPSLLAHMFDFGDVVIKTPGEATEFIWRGIPRPREVQQELMARLDDYRLKEQSGVDQEIEGWLKAYHEVLSET
jgi:hypothetical protein